MKLIHMGGRVYDPLIGRFLSRDPYIDGMGSSQGANGYAYVWNNPLSNWDPTGYKGLAENLDTKIVCYEGHCEELENINVTGSRDDDNDPSGSSPGLPLDGIAAVGFGSAAIGTAGESGQMVGFEPISPENRDETSPSEITTALLGATGMMAAISENAATWHGDDLLKSASRRLGLFAGGGSALASWASGDTKGAIVSGAFVVAQIVALTYGSPFVITAVTVATISFTAGQAAGGL